MENKKSCHEYGTVVLFLLPISDVVDNNRFITLDFKVKENCLLHAFAGYFEAVLYKDVTLSKL